MPLSLILIPYGLLFVVFAVMSLFNLFHLVRFGSLTFLSFFVTFTYLAGTVLLVYFTAVLLADVGWTTPLLEFSSGSSLLGP